MAVKYTKTGHTPSNKTQKYPLQLTALAYSYGKGSKNVSVFKPVIDKISICVPIADPEERAFYETQIMDLSKDQDFPDFETVSAKDKSYKYNMKWRHTGSGKAVLIQAHPYSPSTVTFLRFEFNPNLLGVDGISAFKEMLNVLFSFEHLTYADIIQIGRFTRLDIAVDLVNARTSDLIVRGRGKGKKVVYYSSTDQMETTYLDKPKKAPSKAKVYDKLQQQTDKSISPDYVGVSHARVEIQHGGTKLNKLLNIHNVLKRIKVIHPTTVPAGIDEWVWNLFLDSCRYRGIDEALKMLPEDQQGKALKVLKKAETETWRPKKLWEEWPETVAKYGLLEP